jgi:hypothetical protein
LIHLFVVMDYSCDYAHSDSVSFVGPLTQWLPLNCYYAVFSAISMVYFHLLELSENCLKQCDVHDSDKKHAVSIFITSK